MFNKFIQFWNIVWNSIKDAYNQTYKPQTTESNVQKYNEIKIFNFLWAVVVKLINLACIEATIDIESDSVLVDALKPYAENIQKKLKSIGRIALATGSYFVFPTTNSNGNLIHTPIEKERVFILDDDGTRITKAMVILDEFVDDKNNTFYKIGNYRLDANGDLFISYSVTDNHYKKAFLKMWEDIDGYETQFKNANCIGFGHFCSNISSVDGESLYGYPLNSRCEDVEQRLLKNRDDAQEEIDNGKSVVFADETIVREVPSEIPTVTNARSKKFKIVERLFTFRKKAGDTGPFIDIYSPQYRYETFQAYNIDLRKEYEECIGVDRGFLTPFDNGNATTATEIRRANANTIAMIDAIRDMLKDGIEQTLQADAMFLSAMGVTNINPEMYDVKIDWFDAFDDTDKQYERIANAVDRGTAEEIDEMRWLFPDLDDEKLKEKLARIADTKQTNTDQALERILAGQ